MEGEGKKLQGEDRDGVLKRGWKRESRQTEWKQLGREKGVEMQRERECVKESDCSFESFLHVLAGHHSAVRSTFPGQGLLVTLMAWKEDHVTLSPRRDANMAVAFVSSAPSLLHNSLEVTNWSWETGFFVSRGLMNNVRKSRW